jgi:hypothetical protein
MSNPHNDSNTAADHDGAALQLRAHLVVLNRYQPAGLRTPRDIALRMGADVKVLLSLVLLIVLAVGGYIGYLVLTSEPPVFYYSVKTSSKCSYSTGRPNICEITLTSEPSSTGDFNWRVYGEPDMISASPASGSLGAGLSSTITISLPCLRQPVVVVFEDDSHSTSTRHTIPAIKKC